MTLLFEPEFFIEFSYSEQQIETYFRNAELDLARVESVQDPNLVYRIGYEAVLKLGIAIIAQAGYKIKSVPGSHGIFRRCCFAQIRVSGIINARADIILPFIDLIRKLGPSAH